MKYITLSAFANFCLYAFSSLVLLAVFTKLYLWTTPYDEVKQIRRGSVAPALALGGALLGFTFPMLSVSYHGVNIFDFLIWTVLAGLIQVGLFKFLYWVIPMQADEDNVAIAVLYAFLAVCVGLVNAFSLIPQ